MISETGAVIGELRLMAAGSDLGLQQVRFAGAGRISPAFATQEPAGLDVGDVDEAEEDQSGDRHAGFVIGPGPRGNSQ
jgi:hypothetical protein